MSESLTITGIDPGVRIVGVDTLEAEMPTGEIEVVPGSIQQIRLMDKTLNERMFYLTYVLSGFLNNWCPDLIVIEQPWGSQGAVKIHSAIINAIASGVAISAASRFVYGYHGESDQDMGKSRVRLVYPSQWQRYMKVKGKDACVASVKAKFNLKPPLKPSEHHAADAIKIAEYGAIMMRLGKWVIGGENANSLKMVKIAKRIYGSQK